MKNTKFKSLIISLALPFLAGGIGSYFTAPAIRDWYSTLNKPFFNPPNWIFGPVWTLLYIFMGLSLYLYWTAIVNKSIKLIGVRIFLIQLGLNSLWSVVFFNLQSPLSAFIVICVLWMMIFLTIREFMKVSQIASWLLIPYLAWVSFATILNFSIMYLN